MKKQQLLPHAQALQRLDRVVVVGMTDETLLA
jgi:hypothetical protein